MPAEEPQAPRAPEAPQARGVPDAPGAPGPERRPARQLLAELYGLLARLLLCLAPVYLAGYLGLSVSWLVLGALLWTWWRRNRHGKRQVLGQELPAWIHFADVERVEWANKIVVQIWPYLSIIMENQIREKLEPKIRGKSAHLRTFTFTRLCFGQQCPRVNGVQVHTDLGNRRRVALDLQICYVGDCEVSVEVQKLRAGVSGVQLQGTLRVILEPLLVEKPFVGAVTLCFLRKPHLQINWTGLTNLLDAPGIDALSDGLLEELLAAHLVLPNRVTVPVKRGLDVSALRFPLPRGVLRVHLRAAAGLAPKDSFLGLGRSSDPYAQVRVGLQRRRSRTVYRSLSPVWGEVFEFPVHEVPGQDLEVDLYDEDAADRDDFLGSLQICLGDVRSRGVVDEWRPLDDAPCGRLHLRLEWLTLLAEPPEAAAGDGGDLASALLVVFLEGACNLPAGPFDYLHGEYRARKLPRTAKPRHPGPGLARVPEVSGAGAGPGRARLALSSGSSWPSLAQELVGRRGCRRGVQRPVSLALASSGAERGCPSQNRASRAPSAYVTLSVGATTHRSKKCPRSRDPVWSQAFSFLVHSVATQRLCLQVLDDDEQDCALGVLDLPLCRLLPCAHLTLEQRFQLARSGLDSLVSLRLVLRFLRVEEREPGSPDTGPDALKKGPPCARKVAPTPCPTAPHQKEGRADEPRLADPASVTKGAPQNLTTAREPVPQQAGPEPTGKDSTRRPCGSTGEKSTAPIFLTVPGPHSPGPIKSPRPPRRSTSPLAWLDPSMSLLTSLASSSFDLAGDSHPAECSRRSPGHGREQERVVGQQLAGDLGTRRAAGRRRLGQVQLTVRYVCLRRCLRVLVGRCRDLTPCSGGRADPYVRVYLLPDTRWAGRRRTAVRSHTLEPVFDETFQFFLPLEEAQRRSLDVAVKSRRPLGSHRRRELGKVLIELCEEDLIRGFSRWYELTLDGRPGR
ncbi:extended synaptotagmin-3 [Thomomys bottae]